MPKSETKRSVLDEMVRIKLTPIIAGLADRAYEQVVSDFCREKCGHSPEVKFCPEAKTVYRLLLSMHCQAYSGLN